MSTIQADLRGLGAAFGLACVLLAPGCSRGVAWLEARERAEPLMERAAVKAEAGEKDDAIRLYEEALAKDPTLARAHLNLGLLLHDYAGDYVAAVYHYGRYLALRPGTEKRQLIQDRIRVAKQAFAASVMGPSRGGEPVSDAGSTNAMEQAARILDLEQQVAGYRNRIAVLERQLAERPRPPAGATNATPRVTRETPRTAARTYRVQRGDTLSAIAARHYGGDSGQWQRIAEANRDKLRGSSQVQEGQVLVIP